MNLKNKLILFVCLLSLKSVKCEDALDQAVTFAKGVGAAVVTTGACDGFMEFLHGKNFTDSDDDKDEKTAKDLNLLSPTWIGHCMKTLAHAYSISKIAPYARRSLNLRQDVLLDGPMREISRNRGKATVNAIGSGLMSAACIFHIFREISKEKLEKENTHLIAFNFSRALSLAYALYKFAPDAYRHMRVALAI